MEDESIIGLRYVLADSSYAICISRKQEHTISLVSKFSKIVSEPYQVRVGNTKTYKEGFVYDFIQVEYKGDIYRVLYFKDDVKLIKPVRIHDEILNETWLDKEEKINKSSAMW